MSQEEDSVSDADVVVKGNQTLMRGLRLLECVGVGIADVKRLSRELGIPRTTTHRVIVSLMRSGYLRHSPGGGYVLGPKLIEMGRQALDQRPLQALARNALEDLAALTKDTVHLGARDGSEVFYLDKIPGTRGLGMRSRVGGTMPLASTGIGRALMVDLTVDQWRPLYDEAVATRQRLEGINLLPQWSDYVHSMQTFAAQGWVLDLEENELGVRCVAVPVRDRSGEIVCAVSVASASPYMPLERLHQLAPEVLATAGRISRELE